MAPDQIKPTTERPKADIPSAPDQAASPEPLGTEELFCLLERAIILATEAHRGQRDKAGRPYILHPLRLMFRQKSPEAMIIAVLHDVVEDTALTFADLEQAGFPASVITALTLLTHDKELPYMEYIAGIAKNSLAILVKLADLQDNMDISRIPQPTSKDYSRLEKYSKAFQYLSNFRDWS